MTDPTPPAAVPSRLYLFTPGDRVRITTGTRRGKRGTVRGVLGSRDKVIVQIDGRTNRLLYGPDELAIIRPLERGD